MPNHNSVHLMGHLVRDPELRYSQSGTAFCSFSIATNRKFKSGGEDREETYFGKCKAFGWAAELVGGLKKGDPVTIVGRLVTESWDDKKSGEKKSTTVVVCEQVHQIAWERKAKGGDEDAPPPAKRRSEPKPPAEPDYGDIPF